MTLPYLTPENIESDQIRHQLRSKGFSVRIWRGAMDVTRMDVFIKASKIIPDGYYEEFCDRITEVEYLIPATTIDYLKCFLVRLFPYLTAPAFQPKSKTTKKSVEVKQKVVTKVHKIFIGADRNEYIEVIKKDPLVKADQWFDVEKT